MNTSDIFPLEINGIAPVLAGSVCSAFICEAFVYDGNTDSSANVSYLCFDGRWHRLYFDCGIVFWRADNGVHKPWSVPEKLWDYPHTDVGQLANVVGRRLHSYCMQPTDKGSKVEFMFEGEVNIILEDENDRSHYRIVRAEND